MSFKHHYNLIYNDLERTLNEFRWDSFQTKMGFKASLSCITAIIIANWIKLENPFWAGITTLVIIRPNVGAIFNKGWMRALGCTIGCLYCYYFMGFLIQSPILFSLFIMFGISIAFYAGVQAKYGYFWSYMLANMVLIGMISISNPYENVPLHIVFYRSAEISLGVVVSWFYSIILWPNYAGNDIETKAKKLLSGITDIANEIITEAESNKKYSSEKISENFLKIKDELSRYNSLITDAITEKKLARIDNSSYEYISRELRKAYKYFFLAHSTFMQHKDIHLTVSQKNNLKTISRILSEISFENFSNTQQTIKRLKKLKSNINISKPENEEIKESVGQNTNCILAYYQILFSLDFYINTYISVIEKFQINLKGQTESKSETAKSENKNRSVSHKDFDSDFMNWIIGKKAFLLYIPAVKNAIKGALAILITFWGALWLDIPGGYSNMTVAIIAVFAPQMDNISTKHKGVLRFVGCLTGAALGLFFLLLNIDSFFFLILSLFIITFFLGIIQAGRPGCAYIGLQASIAFLICLAGNFTPSITIAEVIERLTGIFLAISSMWFIYYIMWPEDIEKKLYNTISDLRKVISHTLRSDRLFKKTKDIDRLEIDSQIYSDALVNIDSKAKVLLKVLKLQQDIPVEKIQNIRRWAENIRIIGHKLITISELDQDIFNLFKYKMQKLYRALPITLEAVISSSRRADSLLNYTEKLIDEGIENIRKEKYLKDKSEDFKKEYAVLLLILQSLIKDSQTISRYES